MAELAYPIPAHTTTFEEEIKKSRFITTLGLTQGLDASKEFVRVIKTTHPDARHHCWGCVSRCPSDSTAWGFSDDGEPSGTAGKPILAQLCGSGIGEITAVVTRYSGGIKLGTGGLVKAYGGGVKQALMALPTDTRQITSRHQLEFDYADESAVIHCLSLAGAVTVKQHYHTRVSLVIDIPQDKASKLSSRITDVTRGKGEFSPAQENQ